MLRPALGVQVQVQEAARPGAPTPTPTPAPAALQTQLLTTEALVLVSGGGAGSAGSAGRAESAATPPGARVAAASAALECGRRLLLAARAGDTPAVRSLLAAGAPFTADWLGTSPLHLAAANNHLETVEVLLRAGVSRDARTKVERTPLHLAASAGHCAIVAALLGYGANVDCRDMLGMTPLHWAAERGHAAAARALLAAGADAGAVSKFRKTPLGLAARHPDPALHALFAAELAARAARVAQAGRAQRQTDTDRDFELQLQHRQQQTQQQQLKQHKVQKPQKEQATEQLSNISFEAIKFQKTPEKKPIKVKLVNSPKCEPKMSSKPETVAGAACSATSAGEAAALLQRHGITLLPHDAGSTVLSALQCGRTVVLSDAGKLMLKESLSPTARLTAASAAGAQAGAGEGGAGAGAVLSLGALNHFAPPAAAPALAPAPTPTKVLKKVDPVQFQKVKLIQMSEGGKVAAPLKPVRLKLRARGSGGSGGGGVRLLLQRAPLQRLERLAPADQIADNTAAQPEIQTKSSSGEDSSSVGEVAALRAQLAAARATIAELRRQLAARPSAPAAPTAPTAPSH